MNDDRFQLELEAFRAAWWYRRIARTFIVKDPRALARRFVALANGTRDLVRIVVSHHEVIARDPAEVLRGIATTL